MYYDWSSKVLSWPGMTVQLSHGLSEHYVDNLGECVIVAHGNATGIDQPVTVKLRADVIDLSLTRRSPKLVDVDDHDRHVAFEDFVSECAALEDSTDSGHTPRLLSAGTIQQDSSMPYPDGYLRAIVMSTVPGQNVRRILLDLSDHERDTIRDQLASVLEYMRQKGWYYSDPKPENLIYLVDLASAILEDKVGDRITPESNIVEMFGVWDEYARRSDRSLSLRINPWA
ncbi:MAG: hypothetical protein M1840_006605 [Geoglossum simile]|nr:MAG: hypothetical protein M1840_006605 [Geoglossum simile]